MRLPKDVKELQSVLASCNQVRYHIKDYNSYIAPFSHLLKKSVPWSWSPALTTAYERLKKVMASPEVLRPFDPSLPSRIFTDFNGALDKRRPALGASLWQKAVNGEWHPVGYASRYLSVAENRLILIEAAYSSSIGECLGLSFALRYFYPELSTAARFEVMIDARNLLYWKTSVSPLMINLRATIAGLYDLSAVNLIHVPRKRQFADFLGRLSHDEVPADFNEFDETGTECYVFRANTFLTPPVPSSSLSWSCVADAPDGYLPTDFSEEELSAMKSSRAKYVVAKGRPVYRKLHSRNLYVVPLAKLDALFTELHIDSTTGMHRHAIATRTLFLPYSWSSKHADLEHRLSNCGCLASRGHKGIKPLEVYTGQQARPGSFGAVVYFDQKSFMTHSGRKYIGTCLDKSTGLVKGILIDAPTGGNAIAQVEDFLTLGKPIAAAVFDRHASYLNDQVFRKFLSSNDITPYYSKGDNPTMISDLERVHGEMNFHIRTLHDPWDWEPSFRKLLYLINSAPSQEGMSRAGLAFGHTLLEAHAIARRHKSLKLALSDSKLPDIPQYHFGDKVKLDKKFSSQNEEPFEIVTVIAQEGATILVQHQDSSPSYEAIRRIYSLPKAAYDPAQRDSEAIRAARAAPPAESRAQAAASPAPLPPRVVGDPAHRPLLAPIDVVDEDSPVDVVDEDSPLIPARSGPSLDELEMKHSPELVPAAPRQRNRSRYNLRAIPSHSLVQTIVQDVVQALQLSSPAIPVDHRAEVFPEKGDFLIMAERGKPWIARVDSVLKDNQLWVSQFIWRDDKEVGTVIPLWLDADRRPKAKDTKPKGDWSPARYLVSGDAIVSVHPLEPSLGPLRLPLAALASFADYRRDPGNF